jgi:hypothetical protein
MNLKPVLYSWSGEAMVPLTRFDDLCNRQFVVGENYLLDVVTPPSTASRNHYFAQLSDSWKNLPDRIAKRFPSPSHLRSWALVKAGYADEKQIVYANNTEAVKGAALIRTLDEYAVIRVIDEIVIVWRAKSQSARAMGKEEFNKSKQAVLDIVSGLINVSRQEFEDHGAGQRMADHG